MLQFQERGLYVLKRTDLIILAHYVCLLCVCLALAFAMEQKKNNNREYRISKSFESKAMDLELFSLVIVYIIYIALIVHLH